MSIDLKKALKYCQKDLEKEWPNLDFEYLTNGKDKLTITANVTLGDLDDDIRIIIDCNSSGGFECRAVFDKLDKTDEVLYLVNKFNEDKLFFKLFVREDNYLELSHFFICYNEKTFKDYATEFLLRLLKLREDEIILRLTSITREELEEDKGTY